MSSYEASSAVTGEKTIHRAFLHWIGYVPAFALALFAIWLSSLVWIAGLLFAGAAYIFAAHAIRQFCTEIVVTDRRLIYKTGLVSRDTVEIGASKVEGVELRQGLLGRLLGYGDLSIRGTGIGTVALRGVAEPVALRRALAAR
jgi:uncharacterized membrane protein YdbT with pleckstrin-like domain